MKPYDELPWWCQLPGPWTGPPWYAEIEDFDAWLVAVRHQLAQRADELTEQLTGQDIPGEGYLARARRLTAARHQAEQTILHDYGQLSPDEGGENEPPPPGNGR